MTEFAKKDKLSSLPPALFLFFCWRLHHQCVYPASCYQRHNHRLLLFITCCWLSCRQHLVIDRCQVTIHTRWYTSRVAAEFLTCSVFQWDLIVWTWISRLNKYCVAFITSYVSSIARRKWVGKKLAEMRGRKLTVEDARMQLIAKTNWGDVANPVRWHSRSSYRWQM